MVEGVRLKGHLQTYNDGTAEAIEVQTQLKVFCRRNDGRRPSDNLTLLPGDGAD